MKRQLLFVTVAAVVGWPLAVHASPSYPSPEQTQVAKTATYVGSDACSACHSGDHATWITSRHTKKATQGPVFGKEFEKNIYDWVRRDWDKLDTYMIVDTKDAKTNYMAARKVPIAACLSGNRGDAAQGG